MPSRLKNVAIFKIRHRQTPQHAAASFPTKAPQRGIMASYFGAKRSANIDAIFARVVEKFIGVTVSVPPPSFSPLFRQNKMAIARISAQAPTRSRVLPPRRS